MNNLITISPTFRFSHICKQWSFPLQNVHSVWKYMHIQLWGTSVKIYSLSFILLDRLYQNMITNMYLFIEHNIFDVAVRIFRKHSELLRISLQETLLDVKCCFVVLFSIVYLTYPLQHLVNCAPTIKTHSVIFKCPLCEVSIK